MLGEEDLLLLSALLVLSLANGYDLLIPPIQFADVQGPTSFCQVQSWFSANVSLQYFQQPIVGHDGTIYVMSAENGNSEPTQCNTIAAFDSNLNPIWNSACGGDWDVQMTLDDARGLLYIESDGFITGDTGTIRAYNTSNGKIAWEYIFDTPQIGQVQFDYDLANTGNIYFVTISQYNETIEDVTVGLSYLDYRTGRPTHFHNITYYQGPYNWTVNGQPYVPEYPPNYYPQVSGMIFVKNSVIQNTTIYLTLSYSVSGVGRYYDSSAVIKSGLYGFSMQNGSIVFQEEGVGLISAGTSSYHFSQVLFVDGDFMYFLSDLNYAADDVEILGYNFAKKSIFMRFPTYMTIFGYIPAQKLLLTGSFYNQEVDKIVGIDVSTPSAPKQAFSYNLANQFLIYAVDSANNFFGASVQPISGNHQLNSIRTVSNGKNIMGPSGASVLGVALGVKSETLYTVDQKSIRAFSNCPGGSEPLSAETVVTIVIGALTVIFDFADFVLTKMRGGIGPKFISTSDRIWKIFLLAFLIITNVILTIVGSVSQVEIYNSLTKLTKTLSDIPTFYENYVVPDCSSAPNFDPEIMCFCTTGNEYDDPNSICHVQSCSGWYDCESYETGCTRTYDCNTIIDENCLCQYYFYQWECTCNLPNNLNDTYCRGTTQNITKTYQTGAASAFNACYAHYKSIINLLWAVFTIHLFVTAVTIVLRVKELTYLGTKENEGFLGKKLPKILTAISVITTGVLVIACAVVSKEGQVCTQPDNYDTSSITDTRYIMNKFPSCSVNNAFYQLGLEGQIYGSVVTSLTVVGAKPAFALVDLIHQALS